MTGAPTRAVQHGLRGFCLLGSVLLILGAQEVVAQQKPAISAKQITAKAAPRGAWDGRYARNGVVVQFSARAIDAPDAALLEGQLAEVRLRITDEASGNPVQGLAPAAWMDIADGSEGHAGGRKSCNDRIALYLKGVVGMRPMIDLNGYFVVVLNKDANLTVVDPLVSMAGKTSTFATVPLKRPGTDWVQSADAKMLFVSMSQGNEVAVVDTDTFKVKASIASGVEPTRIALQPDGKYLWVGNNSSKPQESGVTIIDTETLKSVATLATGLGHHEIAFSLDSRYAFVSNRDAGTVSVIDIRTRRKLKDIPTGPLPISVAYSKLARSVYVADGKQGSVSVIDAERLQLLKRIQIKPGIGPLRFTPDARWGFVLNPSGKEIGVIDASGNELVHSIALPSQPFQVTFTRAFAYVRSLDSERVAMINLASIGPGKKPTVQSFAAGSGAPQLAKNLVIADMISAATTEAAVFVVNPVDNTTYFYMEGMNAPAGNYVSFGTSARAVTVVDRSLKQVKPGVYATKIRVPVSGNLQLAVLMDTPRLMHCFYVQAKPNPYVQHDSTPLAIEYLSPQRRVKAGGTVMLRFKLIETNSRKPKAGLNDVRVLYYLAPGKRRTEVAAKEVGGGVYEAALALPRSGAYYIYTAVTSLKVQFDDLPFTTLRAELEKDAPAAPHRAAQDKG
jgi:YVTN family beta-propeller protein